MRKSVVGYFCNKLSLPAGRRGRGEEETLHGGRNDRARTGGP